MRLVRGRAPTPEADRRVTAELLERTAETGAPALRVWTPHRKVSFGPQDARAPGYPDAARAAAERGFTPVERRAGGRAVAYTGTTVAFARSTPIEDLRTGLEERYEDVAARVAEALGRLGVDARPGEPADSFCPGAHSLRCEGKVAGIAQRIAGGAALVGGVVIVSDRDRIADVLDATYAALDVPFNPDSVGSVARAGGPDDPECVVDAIESAFLDDRDPTVERLGRRGDRDGVDRGGRGDE